MMIKIYRVYFSEDHFIRVVDTYNNLIERYPTAIKIVAD